MMTDLETGDHWLARLTRREWIAEDFPDTEVRDLTPSWMVAFNADRLCCEVHPGGNFCTRLDNHRGRHAAGNGRYVLAVWA